MKKIKYIFLFALFLTCSHGFHTNAFAQARIALDNELLSVVKSVEALGMGGAYYSKSNNKYAAFYNPAGVARVKGTTIEYFPLTIGVDSDAISSLSSVSNIISATGGSLSDPNVIANSINSIIDIFIGKFVTIGPITFFPAYTRKGLSIGLFSNTVVKATAYNPAISELQAVGRSDNGFTTTLGYNFLKNDALSFGVSFKALVRAQIEKTYTIFDLTDIIVNQKPLLGDIFTDLFENGLAVGAFASVGIIYDLPFLRSEIAPRIAVSINDVGYLFRLNDSNVDAINPSLNVSLGISPSYYNTVKSDIMIDFVDLFFLNSNDNSILKRINIGAEVLFIDTYALRVGIHQGYPTFGAGLNFKYFKLNYAFYTEELGHEVGDFRDFRHALEIVFKL